MSDEVIGILSDVLGEPPETFAGQALLGACPRWDSLGTLRVVTRLESELGIHLDLRGVHSARTVHDLVALVEEARTG